MSANYFFQKYILKQYICSCLFICCSTARRVIYYLFSENTFNARLLCRAEWSANCKLCGIVFEVFLFCRFQTSIGCYEYIIVVNNTLLICNCVDFFQFKIIKIILIKGFNSNAFECATFNLLERLGDRTVVN